MRITETLTKSGFFWLPSDSENKLPGTLSVLDGGKIELEVLGFFKGHQPLNDASPIHRIVGIIEKDGYVTLDDCFYTNSTMTFGGISKARIFVRRALVRIGYDDQEPVVLNEFRFSVEGLDDWFGLSGIQTTDDFANKTATITYIPQDEITFDLDNGLQLAFGLSWTFPGSHRVTEAKITQKAYMRLRASEPRPLDEFTSTARLLTNFLCFATDETVAINSVTGRMANPPSKEGEEAERLDMGIVYQSLPFSEKPPKAEWHRMLFRFPQVRDSAHAMINKWLAAYETFQPALDLYFSARTGAHRFIDSRFLALAQAVETLHRRTSNETFLEQDAYDALAATIVGLCSDEYKEWLRSKLAYGNEISLAQRLKRTIEPFKDRLGSSEDRKKLVRSIVDTRNYLTHYDETLRDRVADGADLYHLCEKLEGILQLRFFMEIGFSPTQIDNVMSTNERLRSKLEAQPRSHQ